MDFKLSEEERLLKNTAAQFVDRELLKLEGAFLKQKEPFLPPGDPPRRDLDRELRNRLVEKAKAVGLWALDLPEELGGGGLSHIARVLIYREFGRTVLPFAPPPVPPVMKRSAHAKRVADGEWDVSFVSDEIHRTGATREIQVSYSKRADGFVLSTPGIDVLQPTSGLFILPAKEKGSGNIGLFLVERGFPGVVLSEETDLTTDQTVARLALNGCQIGGDRLIGDEGDLRSLIAAEQLRLAARSLGIGMRCLAASLEHARNRVTFGAPLSSRQAIQWMVADLSIALRTATWLTLEAAWKADQELPYFEAAALAKKRATRLAFEAADTAIQIHGGYGVCKEFPFEAFYREARLMRLQYGREVEIDRSVAEKFFMTEVL